MTNKDTLNWCRNFQDNLFECYQNDARYTAGLEAMQTCIEALNKQIPVKPDYNEYGDDCGNYHCPRCNHIIFRSDNQLKTCCENCFQIIEWRI